MKFITIITVDADVNEAELSFDEKVGILDAVLDSGAESTNIGIHAEVLKEVTEETE